MAARGMCVPLQSIKVWAKVREVALPPHCRRVNTPEWKSYTHALLYTIQGLEYPDHVPFTRPYQSWCSVRVRCRSVYGYNIPFSKRSNIILHVRAIPYYYCHVSFFPVFLSRSYPRLRLKCAPETYAIMLLRRNAKTNV